MLGGRWGCSLQVPPHASLPNPKSEARNPKEIRSPKPERLPAAETARPQFHPLLRTSDFGLPSGFGPRILDFRGNGAGGTDRMRPCADVPCSGRRCTGFGRGMALRADSAHCLCFHLGPQRRKDLRAGLFGRGEASAAMLALCAIHYSELLAIGAGFARGPFLHAQEGQQPRHAEEEMEYRPTQPCTHRQPISAPQPPTRGQAHQRHHCPIDEQRAL